MLMRPSLCVALLLILGVVATVQAQPIGFDKTDLLDAAVQGKGFGEAVAISGNVAVIGEGGSVVTPGRVYVYERDASTGLWTQTGGLQAAQPLRGDGFGQAV